MWWPFKRNKFKKIQREDLVNSICELEEGITFSSEQSSNNTAGFVSPLSMWALFDAHPLHPSKITANKMKIFIYPPI